MRLNSLLLAAILSLVLWPMSVWALSAQEQRGQRIYLQGSSPGGDSIQAYVGAEGIPLPASILPCTNCHGPDGRGRPEGGVIPSNITWSQLTKSYGLVSVYGRRSPPYDEQSLTRAITQGVDSAGNRLDSAMPRFEIDTADMADLIAYLKVMERTLDPGLTAERILLGTVMPASVAPNSLGRVLQDLLQAYFGDINDRGGIYHRRVQLQVAEAQSQGKILEAGQRLMKEQQVFALVAALTAGEGALFSELAEQHRVPLIGPLTQFSDDNNSLNRYSFFIQAGQRIQQRALLDYCVELLDSSSARLGILYPQSADKAALATLLEEQAAKHGGQPVIRLSYPSARLNADDLVSQLKSAGVEALFFLGDGKALRQWTQVAEQQRWTPYLFLSNASASLELLQDPGGFRHKIFIATPSLPTDLSAEGRREFQEFHRRHQLSSHHLRLQIAAYAAAKLLVKGLKQAGQKLSRDKLITALEELYQYETGLTPPLTFGPNRHLGSGGAYVVRAGSGDAEPGRESRWVVPK